MSAKGVPFPEHRARWADKKTIWGCPCGYRGTFGVVSSHRKGWKNRPECAKGKIFQSSSSAADEPTPGQSHDIREDDLISDDSDAEPDDGKGIVDADDSSHLDWASGVPADLDDPEEIARILNRRNGVAPNANGESNDPFRIDDLGIGFDQVDSQSVNGNEESDPFGLKSTNGVNPPLGEGDWHLMPPSGIPEVSEARETVSLPVVVRLMYDWARQQGWSVGDGSISAFVTDCLLDHFNNCWGKAIVVVDRKEVLRA